ncbi:AraC-like DNA-binding protein [Sinobacterium caligoides]|uniref:AraC-like DNA-binding protein n=1 Tax=Sinobacterium caligoides TaxID=933926 RepID=A0A3N2DG44_9GAMM|nr:AraC family transcriptional regulator [Sinobacterium caligoides]ROR98780.1 AraC-like DNA-binding protein [Sinobacterium caligoides]
MMIIAIAVTLLLAASASIATVSHALFNRQYRGQRKACLVMLMLAYLTIIGELAVYHFASESGGLITPGSYYYIVTFSAPLGAAIPVFLFLYLKSILSQHAARRDLLHLVLPLLYLLLMLPYSGLSLADKQAFFHSINQGQDVAWPLSMTPTRSTRLAVWAIFGLFYLQLGWRELQLQADSEALFNVAVRKLLLLFGSAVAVLVVFIIVRLPHSMTGLLSLLTGMLAIATSGLYLYHQRVDKTLGAIARGVASAAILPVVDVAAASDDSVNKDTASKGATGHSGTNKGASNTAAPVAVKSYRSSVTEKAADALVRRLTRLMEDGNYKDSKLSLGKLAQQLDTSTHHLSHAINQHYQGGYFQLVHCYRIEEAKRLLAESTLTIAEITYEVGYNSKSVFYGEFKRQTRQTPSQYKKSFRQLPLTG